MRNLDNKKITKASMWHESLILVLYLFFSPIMFGMVYPEPITGDGGMLYVVILFIAVPTIFISGILILVLKKRVQSVEFELYYGIIIFLISCAIFFLGFSDGDQNFRNTFFITNTSLIIGLYLLSVYYKVNKQYPTQY